MCLRHGEDLCHCPPSSHSLFHRCDRVQLAALIDVLRGHMDAYNRWIQKVSLAINAVGDARFGQFIPSFQAFSFYLNLWMVGPRSRSVSVVFVLDRNTEDRIFVDGCRRQVIYSESVV